MCDRLPRTLTTSSLPFLLLVSMSDMNANYKILRKRENVACWWSMFCGVVDGCQLCTLISQYFDLYVSIFMEILPHKMYGYSTVYYLLCNTNKTSNVQQCFRFHSNWLMAMTDFQSLCRSRFAETNHDSSDLIWSSPNCNHTLWGL